MFCSQLFGEIDPDQDVSPDTEDPEAAGDAGETALQTEACDEVAGVWSVYSLQITYYVFCRVGTS